VPKADIGAPTIRSPCRRGRGNIQTKRLRCFEINDQIEFYGLLDRELCRVCALENLIDIRGDTKSGLGQIVDTVSIRERPSY